MKNFLICLLVITTQLLGAKVPQTIVSTLQKQGINNSELQTAIYHYNYKIDYRKAAQSLKKCPDIPLAQAMRALLVKFGDGQTIIDIPKAKLMFQECLPQIKEIAPINPEARYLLALASLNGLIEEDKNQAAETLLDLAKQEHMRAAISYAECVYNQQASDHRSTALALFLAKKAAEKNLPEGVALIALNSFHHSKKIPTETFIKAAKLGSWKIHRYPETMKRLSSKSVLKILNHGIKHNHMAAYVHYALSLRSSTYHLRNKPALIENAKKNLLIAAESNFPEGSYTLAYMLYSSKSDMRIKKNRTEARYWFMRSNELGHKEAQRYLNYYQ